MEPPGVIVVVVTTVSAGTLAMSAKSADVWWYGPRLIRLSVVLVTPEGAVACATPASVSGQGTGTGDDDDDAFRVRATPFDS